MQNKENIEAILKEIQNAKKDAIKIIEELRKKNADYEISNNFDKTDYKLLDIYCESVESNLRTARDTKIIDTPDDFINNLGNDRKNIELALVKETRALLGLMDEIKMLKKNAN